MSLKFKLLAKKDSAVIDITDLIGLGGFYAEDMREALNKAKDVKSLTVRLTSDGGEITQGLAIYGMLRSHSAKVRVEVLGVAASMGSVIAMAGDEIAMAEDAFMMIHNPAGGAEGGEDDLRGAADLLAKMKETLVDIYARRTGQKPEDISAAMDQETWLTAKEALALGYCTEIIPATNMAARVRRFNKTPKALQRAQSKAENMDPELLAKLGLKDDATLEDVVAALDVLQNAAAKAKNADDDDDDKPPADEGDDDDEKPPANETARARARREASAALTARTSGAVVKMLAKLEKKIDGIGKRVDGDARKTLIAQNISKFTPALEKVAKNWPLDVLQEYITNAAESAEVDSEADDEGERGASRVVNRKKDKDTTVTAEERHVAKLMGQSEEELLAFKKNGLRLVKKASA